MFKSTSVKLRHAAARTEATAQRLLATASAAQAKAIEQRKLAAAVEAKEYVAELQLQAAAERSVYIQAENAYARACAERNVLEASLASCKIKVDEANKALGLATDSFDKATETVEKAQAELLE
jgi:hypothetical protein